MASRSVVTLTTAPAGTGKSYRRCAHFIVTELLPDTNLKHLSNFPIHLEPWEEDEKQGLIKVCERRGVATREEIEDRIETIDERELSKWLDGTSGPWETFKEKDLSGYHLAIDEIHNFCGKNTNVNIRKKWQAWLGELRHRGARIEFISQHPQKIAKEIRDEAEIMLELVQGESRRDPFFNIGMGDWYNVRAFFTRRYTPCVYELENRQRKSRWSVVNTVRFVFESDLFEVYDSFSTPVQGGQKGKVDQEPFERFSPLKFWLWFVGRNFMQLSSRIGIVALFAWLGLFGGGGQAMTYGMEWMKTHVGGPNAMTLTPLGPGTSEPNEIQAIRDRFPGSVVTDLGGLKTPTYEAVQATPPAPLPKLEPITDEQIEKETAPWRIVAITEKQVWFANGDQYQAGETVETGPYRKKKVGRIDLVRRRASIGHHISRLNAPPPQWMRDYATQIIRKRRKSDFQ